MTASTSRVSSVAIVGAGRFGTALACAISTTGRAVTLVSSDASVVSGINTRRINPRNPTLTLGPSVVATAALEQAAQSRCIVLALHASQVAERSRALGAALDGSHIVLHALGSIVPADGARISEVLAANLPTFRVGVLAGPAPAADIAAGRAASMVAASLFDDVTATARAVLSVPGRIRIYASRDLLGVEIASAMAVAYADGLFQARRGDLSGAAHALLVSRGVNEIHKLLVALGSDGRAAFGLAGLGTMLAADGSDAGEVPHQLEAAGYAALLQLAAKKRVAVPLLEAIAKVARGELSFSDAKTALFDITPGME